MMHPADKHLTGIDENDPPAPVEIGGKRPGQELNTRNHAWQAFIAERPSRFTNNNAAPAQSNTERVSNQQVASWAIAD